MRVRLEGVVPALPGPGWMGGWLAMGLRFVGESDTCRDVVPGWKLDGNQGIVDGFTCERQGSEPAWLRRSGTGKDSLMSERVIGLAQRSRSGARDRILFFSISVPQVLNPKHSL
jgi:hypothetical protein